MDGIHRNIGALEARANAQEERLKRIEAKLDSLVDWAASSKGGVRMLFAVGSAGMALAGLVGAWIAKAMSWGQQ
jgi:hypothetical protein